MTRRWAWIQIVMLSIMALLLLSRLITRRQDVVDPEQLDVQRCRDHGGIVIYGGTYGGRMTNCIFAPGAR